MKKSHLVVSFVELSKGIENLRLAWCPCGKLSRKYYEIHESSAISKASYVVEVICEKCFRKMWERWGNYNDL